MIPISDLAILGLATWRLSSLISSEDGPFHVFSLLRFRAGVRYNKMSKEIPSTELARGILCIWCLSVWIGIALCVAYIILPLATITAILPFAVSALAILIGEHISKPENSDD